ncbi:MAG: hypothetical protein WB661_01155, partial [Candidatus Bathyarchaeia archaeon]
IKEYQDESMHDLQSIARRLRALGYQAVPRVDIGSFTKVVEDEASKDRNDVVVLITRKARRGHFEKTREDSALAVLAKYPGKTMIVRRPK